MNFDPITLAMANAHCDSKGGYTVPAKKYTFDGNIEGKPIMDMGDFVMVQISGDVVDVYTVQTLTVNNLTFSVAEFNVGNVDEVGIIAVSGLPYVILPKTGGVFVYYKEGGDVVTEVACKETIVPIDKKYLPGVCLPVVELSADTVAALYSSAQVTANADETAAFIAAKEACLPIIIKANGVPLSVVAGLSTNSVGNIFYFAHVSSSQIISAIFNDDGTVSLVLTA